MANQETSYIPGINQLAVGFVASFEAPDGAKGKDAVCALHMQTTEDAQALERILKASS